MKFFVQMSEEQRQLLLSILLDESVRREAIMSNCSARTTDEDVLRKARKEVKDVADIRDLIENMVEIK